MIRTSVSKMFALKLLPHQDTKCILNGLESFLSASTSYMNITRGMKKKRPRVPVKQNRPKTSFPQNFLSSLSDPLDSIKPSKSNENHTSSKLFKVCNVY